MSSQVETLTIRVTGNDLMQVKDAYNLYDTRSAVKFMFEEQHPTKEILIDQGFTSDPCPINMDTVIITAKGKNK